MQVDTNNLLDCFPEETQRRVVAACEQEFAQWTFRDSHSDPFIKAYEVNFAPVGVITIELCTIIYTTIVGDFGAIWPHQRLWSTSVRVPI